MHIVCSADLHGSLTPEIPPCDLYIIAGDICPNGSPAAQSNWLIDTFTPWINRVPAKRWLACWGNHDFVGEKLPDLVPSHLKPHFLTGRSVKVDDFHIWGGPWQLYFHNWAFNRSEQQLADIYDTIPDSTDIVISHGPPYGYCDFTPSHKKPGTWENAGSRSLLHALTQVRPKLVVTGHIHSGYGVRDDCNHFSTTIANAAQAGYGHTPVHRPVSLIMDDRTHRVISYECGNLPNFAQLIRKKETNECSVKPKLPGSGRRHYLSGQKDEDRARKRKRRR